MNNVLLYNVCHIKKLSVPLLCFFFLGNSLNLTFILSGALGEKDLAAQHVLVEVGAIMYMVCEFFFTLFFYTED